MLWQWRSFNRLERRTVTSPISLQSMIDEVFLILGTTLFYNMLFSVRTYQSSHKCISAALRLAACFNPYP